MNTVKLLVHISQPLKAKLDALRAEGITTSGLIRRLLNQYFATPEQGRKAGKR